MQGITNTEKNGFETILTKKLIEITQIFRKNSKQHPELNITFLKTENTFCCKKCSNNSCFTYNFKKYFLQCTFVMHYTV